jgi:hypothetical protein
MALFTDGTATIQDLMSHDSSILTTSQTENIDLSQKLAIAKNEIGIELTTLLQRSNTYDWEFWLQPNPQLNNIVATPSLQLWCIFQTLTLVYQDAYFNQLNDRYQQKRDGFAQQAKWAMDKLIQTGIGIVSDPIQQAVPPLLTPVPGGQPAMTYFASVSWTNAEGEEGQAGNASCLTVDAGNALAVQATNQPTNAVNWNVFIGPSATSLVIQNPTPLSLDQVWVQAGPLSAAGRGPGSGQAPNYLRALPRVIQRG